MLFLIWETLSFNLMYVAACYLVGTGMCHNMVGLLQHNYTRIIITHAKLKKIHSHVICI